MRTKALIFVASVAAFLTFAVSVSAHHAARAVYENRSITLQGTVIGFEWSNPHSILSVAVKNDKGASDLWHAELLAPREMERAGWTRETVKPGDEVTVTGRPGKYAQHILWLESLQTQDGKKLDRSPNP
jgi:hypothetical protein